jgi:hypothetical protein
MENGVMNILTIVKGIQNFSKLDTELRVHPLVHNIYLGLTAKGTEIRIEFSENLTQEQIDAVTGHVNNFVEVSVLEELYKETTQKQIDGWALYRRIVADMNNGDGMVGYLDTQMLPLYDFLTPLRNMLKDGFFEFALRHFANEIAPLDVFTSEKEDLYLGWIKEKAIKYGGDETTLAYMQQVPKGHYPFGPTGAP